MRKEFLRDQEKKAQAQVDKDMAELNSLMEESNRLLGKSTHLPNINIKVNQSLESFISELESTQAYNEKE